MAAVAGWTVLRKGEEDWQERIERLHERFPKASGERVLQALRDNHGHAGHAATDLRDLEQEGVKDVDPDDSEWVATLLTSPAMFRQYCKSCFQEFDADRNGVLDWSEVVGLTNRLCHQLGLTAPAESSLRTIFNEVDSNSDRVLQEDEFAKFFEMFLRYAFFVEHRRLVGTWQYKSNAGEQDASHSEYQIFQTTDWHLCFEGLQGQCPGGPMMTASFANRTLGGTLELREGWLHGKVKIRARSADGLTTKKTMYGFIRLHCVEGSNDVLISNFKLSPEAEWGENIVAYRKQSDSERTANTPFGKVAIRCIAPNGVAYRGSPEFSDTSEVIIPLGETIFVAEDEVNQPWVQVDGGYLPMKDSAGRPTFELARSDTGSSVLERKLRASQSGLTAAAAIAVTLRCIAPYGVAYRGSPQFFDRSDAMVSCGDKVRVLEQRDEIWFRTVEGWLPTQDAGGKVLFERARGL